MDKTTVQEIMITNPIYVLVTEHLSRVNELFQIHEIRHLPVVDSLKRVIGIITYRDVLRCSSPKKSGNRYFFDKDQLDQFILKHVMTSDPITIHVNDMIIRAVMIMATEKFGCIPIVEDDKTLVGIVTQIDILNFFLQTYEGHK